MARTCESPASFLRATWRSEIGQKPWHPGENQNGLYMEFYQLKHGIHANVIYDDRIGFDPSPYYLRPLEQEAKYPWLSILCTGN